MLITISREFGSGGRELGKRLSEVLNIPCYDNEIIKRIAEVHGFDENYVSHVSEEGLIPFYTRSIGNRFSPECVQLSSLRLQVAAAQSRILNSFAQAGSCVIVGRSADVILQNFNPLNIFVYASREAKIKRCFDHQRPGEDLSESKLLKRMNEIDSGRARHRKAFSDTKWGAKENYHLCINTTGMEIKSLIPALSDYVRIWFSDGDML